LLVLRAFRNWDFPKGLIEDGESYKETIPYANGKIARYYIAVTETEHITLPISHELGKPEHDEWRWVGFDEAEDYLPPRLAAVLDWARETLDKD